MNHYETVFIATPVLSDVQVEEAVQANSAVLSPKTAVRSSAKRIGACASSPTRFRKRPPASITSWSSRVRVDIIEKLETQYRRDERVIRFLTFKMDKYAVEYAEKRRNKNTV